MNEATQRRSTYSVLPKSKFAVKFAGLANLFGVTRGDTFYRCDYDLDEIKAAADTDSYLRLVIKKYTELFFKSGYILNGENDEAIEYLKTRFRLMSYMSDNAFDELLRETAYDLVKFSNAFWIKTRVDSIPFVNAKGITTSGKPVGGYFRVDPSSMLIKFNKNGKLIGYKQVTESMREKEFSPDDVIHFTFDRDPGSEWGKPRWVAALEDIRMLRKVEGENMALLYRYATPLFHAKVGLAEEGKEGTQKEIDDVRQVIENTPPDGMLITNERVSIDVTGADGSAIDVTPSLSYYENRVFTALNTSSSMMGRGGSKQDADSMEEQVHNAVKDNQANFSIQFGHAVITELLLEGGFNPILNEEDIVTMQFNEINLDTKVKTENHELNKFQSNAITFEELRQHLGLKKDSVDESRLFSNMLQQKNEVEQINLNHDHAMELARLNASLSTATASSSSSSGGTASSNSHGYTKKNTGNGKATGTAKKSGSVKNTDSPSNQHGTYSAKVKESIALRSLNDKLKDNKINMNGIKNDMKLILSDAMKSAAEKGQKAAIEAVAPNTTPPDIGFENNLLKDFASRSVQSYLVDIKNRISNISDRTEREAILDSQRYRLDFLENFVSEKAYWYSYIKAAEGHGVFKFKVHCDENSKHSDHAGKIIDARHFNLNDIPGFASHCRCYLSPIIEKGKEQK